MLTLIVDFNAARDGVVRGLLEDVVDGRDLDDGTLVLLRDGEGNEALGSIQGVNDTLIHAAIRWDTWGAEGSIKVVASRSLTTGAASVIESISGQGVSWEHNGGGALPTALEAAEQLVTA